MCVAFVGECCCLSVYIYSTGKLNIHKELDLIKSGMLTEQMLGKLFGFLKYLKLRKIMTSTDKSAKPKKTIDDEIEAAVAKLKKLQETKRLQAAKDLEKNKRLIADLISKEKLDHIPFEKWQNGLNQLKQILGHEQSVASSDKSDAQPVSTEAKAD